MTSDDLVGWLVGLLVDVKHQDTDMDNEQQVEGLSLP